MFQIGPYMCLSIYGDLFSSATFAKYMRIQPTVQSICAPSEQPEKVH